MADDGPFVVEALLLVPWPSAPWADGALLRCAADAIGPLNGKPFSGSGSRARAFLEGRTAAARISLIHPDFGADSVYENAWVSLGVAPDAKLAADILVLSIHLGNPENRVDCQWNLALELVSRLITAVKPSSSCMNGRLVDTDGSALPPERTLAQGFPERITPFVYLGASELTVDLCDALSRLPAFRSQPCGDGWMLVLVESLSERPSEGLLREIGKAAGRTVTYLSPIMPGGETT
ncbi:MAG: hypothetical protein WDN24_20035 [Sphingomonas sp.]